MRFAISKHLNDILILCMKIAFDVCQYGCGFLFRQLWRMEKWHHAGSGNGIAQGYLRSLRRNVQSIGERPAVLRQNIIKWYLALHHKYTFVSTKYVFHQNVLEIKIRLSQIKQNPTIASFQSTHEALWAAHFKVKSLIYLLHKHLFRTF